ncbi:ATP-dependent Clp protease proteolytic subunit [Erwinia oleae]|uniref:ATP-dependent Clp protease proteolytic subunit n=1 Tax=Erwinia oleae TaxID=796334 RepID=UPI000689BBFA|nr:ATP-dependent Clp protease proteolytic subunit [Erwinia oleae]
MKKLIIAVLLLLPGWVMAKTSVVADNTLFADVKTVKITFSGLITPNKSVALQSILDEISQRYVHAENIYLYLNSEGGNMDGALAMFYAIRSTKLKIVTVNQAVIASAATIPYCAGRERGVMREAGFVIHPAQMERLEETNVTPSRLKTSQDYLNVYNRMFRNIYRTCTDLNDEALKKPLESDDTRLYLSSGDALQHKLATRVEETMVSAPVSYFIADD